MTIYHILRKSSFSDDTVTIFNKLPYDNKYCIIGEENVENSMFSFYNSFKELVKNINKEADIVIIHSVFFNVKKIRKIQKPIVWFTWGFDIYSSEEYKRKRLITIPKYKEETNKYLNAPSVYLRRMVTICKDLILHNNSRRYWEHFYKQVTAIAPVLREEFELIKKQNPQYSFKYLYFKYLDSDDNSLDNQSYSSGILLGNSSTVENNHLDVIKILEERNIKTKVCIPISYGDSMYKKYLKKNITSNNVEFLQKYMQKNDYYKYINGYGNVIIGCLRQQAMGNIYRALRTGKRLFLYKDSIIYKHLKALGYVIYTIDDDLFQDIIDTKFDEHDSLLNKQLYKKNNSRTDLINSLEKQLINIKELDS